jgi:hypothetical protein
MANVAILNSSILVGALPKQITLSGTVMLDGVGVIRAINVFKNGDYSSLAGVCSSDVNGDFSLSVVGGSNDYFSIICAGASGENSLIYDYVTGG